MKKLLSPLFLVLILFSISCQKEARVEKSKFKITEGVFHLDGKKFTGIVYENHPNGKVYREWTMLNGIEHGPSAIFYTNGQVDEKIIWKEGKKDGPYEKFYEDGQPEVISQYALDKKDGDFEVFYNNGKILRQVVMIMAFLKALLMNTLKMAIKKLWSPGQIT